MVGWGAFCAASLVRPLFCNMPGSATIDASVFGDSLISLVDDVRRDVKEGLGLRPYRVSLVHVTDPSRRLGDSEKPAETVTVLDPVPHISTRMKNRGGIADNKLDNCGLNEGGLLYVSQISLTYTESELTGKGLSGRFFWRVEDLHGQGLCPREYTIAQPPHISRTCDFGWRIVLRRAEQ